jgi:hypothetical protein
MSTSVAYLRKRLAAIGRHDLLAAADAGEISTFAAAEEAGLVKRQPVTGNGSENEAKRRAWALMRIIGKAPPLKPKPEPRPARTPAHSRPSQETPRNGRSAPTTPPDLGAILAEWEAAQRPLRNGRPTVDPQRETACAPLVPVPAEPERTPFPAHPAVPCTTCTHPCAPAAVREMLDVALAARRGATDLAGSTMPRACCQRLLQCPNIHALIG